MIIKRPVVTEKTIQNYKNFKKATFEVSLDANKNQVKDAVESLYDVSVIDVKSHTRLGKMQYNRKTRKANRRSAKKLMIVQLDPKSKIEVFEVN